VNILQSAYRVFGWLKTAGAVISGLAIFGMMAFIVFDVAGRNLVGSSIRGGFEIVQNYFMPLSIFPALGYVYGTNVLPRMDMVMSRTPWRVRATAIYLLLAAELVIFGLLFYFTLDYAMSGMAQGTAFPAAGVLYPVWPLYFLVPFGIALVLVETAFGLARNLLQRDTAPTMNVNQALPAASEV
jgi:TRAP-type C4-dicarboxylate transport system permease small subunit